MDQVLSSPSINPSAKLVLVVADRRADAGRELLASVASLGQQCGIDRRTAARAVHQLLRRGMLERVSTGGGHTASRYRLRDDAIEWCEEGGAR